MSSPDRGLREVALLHESSQLILAGGDLDAVLHQILLIVRNYFSVLSCAVFLVDDSRTKLYCRVRNGYPDPRTSYRVGSDGVIGWAAKAKQPVPVADVTQESRYISGDPNVKSELALPLLVRGELLGVLDVESGDTNYFSPDIVQVLSVFAGQAALAIETVRLLRTERRRLHQIELMNLIARSASAAHSTSNLLVNLCELISDAFEGADAAILMAFSDGSLTMQARAGKRRPERQVITPLRRASLSPQEAITTISSGSQPSGCYGEDSNEIFISLASCGEVLGGIVIVPAGPGPFSAEEISVAQAVSDVCASAIKNVQLAEQLHRVANTDLLTGMHNRRFFQTLLENEIDRATRYHKPVVAALLNIRKFSKVNEAVGFEGGDRCLKVLARSIQSRIRSNDVMCRFEGDRFAFVFPETDPANVEAVVEKLHAAVQVITFTSGGNEISLNPEVVTAHFPAEAKSAAELLNLLQFRIGGSKTETFKLDSLPSASAAN